MSRRLGDMVRQMVEERESRAPDDLLNGPHRTCECGSPSCGSPIGTPILEPGKRPGV